MYFDQIAFGKRIRQLRMERNMSQEQLAGELGVSTTNYRHIEHGDKGCSVDLLLLLAETFHTSTDYLLGRCQTKKEEEIEQLKGIIKTLDQMIRSI